MALTLGVLAGGLVAWQPARRQRQWTPIGLEVLRAVSDALLDAWLPVPPAERAAALEHQVDRLEATLDALPPELQREVGDLLSLLAFPPGRVVLTGLWSDWNDATAPRIQDALRKMSRSSWALRRQAYHALRDLVLASWFVEPTHWSSIGYPGQRPVGTMSGTPR